MSERLSEIRPRILLVLRSYNHQVIRNIVGKFGKKNNSNNNELSVSR